MNYEQRFVPEGWNNTKENFDLQELKNAKLEGAIVQGFVEKCDEDYNLQINLGNNIIGIIPRNEMDAVNVDELGLTSPNICKNKVNKFVQFKVKEIYDDNRLLLSRKDAEEEILNWVKNDLKVGMTVNRNCYKYQKIRGFCGCWWRNYRTSSY